MSETADKQLSKRRAVIGIVREDGKYLAIKRSAHVRAAGKICFPGGEIEPGETETQALIREFKEELGVAAIPRIKLWQSESPNGIELHWWTAMLAPDQVMRPNAAEVESFEWLTESELRGNVELLPSNQQFFKAFDAGIIAPDLLRSADQRPDQV